MNEFSDVRDYLAGLQDRICAAIETADGGARFHEDNWTRADSAGATLGGGGRTRILRDGAVFEQAGIGFSDVSGDTLPPSATRRTETRFSAIIGSDLFVDAADHHRLQFWQKFGRNHRVQAQRVGQCQGRTHVPTDDRLSRHPHLSAKTADKIPDLPAVMADGSVQPRWAVLALRFAGRAVAVAPTEVPVGEGAEPFFSASSSMPRLT